MFNQGNQQQTQTSDVAELNIFSPLVDEHDYVIDETEGTLPAGLRGTLYRNGPGRLEVNGQPLGHIFDGDGMLSMFSISDGRVHYRNRYVRTNHYNGSQTSKGVPQRGFGTLKPGGPLANFLQLPANVANTSVCFHAGELLALWEGGRPHSLDPDTLETNGIHSFDRGLKWLGAFSAHPKFDPATGDMYNFGVEVMPRPVLRCYRVDKYGRLHKISDLPIPEPVFNHDFALTEKHMVFVIDPLVLDWRNAVQVAAGFKNIDSALRFDSRKGTTIALVPRDGGKPTVTQIDALMHFHVNNAFERDGETVVELVSWPTDWDAFTQTLRAHQESAADDRVVPFGGQLVELRIDSRGNVTQQQLADVPGEFPQFDWRLGCQEHRYTYMAAATDGMQYANSISKLDRSSGTTSLFMLPDEHIVSEPMFVPESESAGEDQGWLLAVAYDSATHRSRLLVLNARDLQAGPVFTGHLKHHVPQSFHGTFTSRVAQPTAA